MGERFFLTRWVILTQASLTFVHNTYMRAFL